MEKKYEVENENSERLQMVYLEYVSKFCDSQDNKKVKFP